MSNLRRLRQLAMSKQRILCTGNPDRPYTIANGIKQLFPTAEFVSQSTGYDLTADLSAFKEKLQDYNVFINASFIENGLQLKLLNTVNQAWKYGHVINIGSSSENAIDTYPNRAYAEHKLALRQRSLELYNYRFRTTHIVLGGLRNDTPERAGWLDTEQVAAAVKWILSADFDVPIIGIEPEKDPW